MTPLLRHHHPEDLVAFGDGGSRTAADLLVDAAKVAASLPEPRPGSQVLAVFETDRYGCAVTLVASWARGHGVLLAPDARPRTVAALLDREEVVRVVHDTRSGGHATVDELLARAPGPEIDLARLPSPLVTVLDGEPLRDWPKTPEQLLREVEAIAEVLDIAVGTRFRVDVPPGHLFGLLHGVLLPLCTGGAFSRAIAPSFDEEAHAEIWVSVPHCLRVAGRDDPSVRRVLSGVEALPDETARALGQSAVVVEVLGSVETGGIAWRTGGSRRPWAPLPGVRTSVDAQGRLVIDSAFLPPHAARPHVTSELVEAAPNGAFVHRGRTDDVVQIDGATIDLAAMRKWLRARPGVLDADVATIETGVPAVLVAVMGREVDPSCIREELLARFALQPGALDLRGVDGLERDAIGRIDRRALLRRFGRGADGLALSTQLEISPDASSDADVVTARARVPTSYVHFEGHFDGYPILAAVVQLQELVLPLARRARPSLGELQELQRLKFLGRISPGDELAVTLRFPPGVAACDFEISRGERRCSAGRMCFAEQEPG
jgi:hypothetical protein